MISGQMNLGQLRLASRQRSDTVNSQFVTDQEFNSYINQSYFELYDVLVQKYGDDYYVAPTAAFMTSGSQQLYPLPDGVLTFLDSSGNPFVAQPFYKLLGVDMQTTPQASPDQWISLKRFNFGERNRWNWPVLQNFYAITNMRYHLTGNNLQLVPLPNGGQTLRLWYVPRMVELVSDSDIVDGVSGWTEYIIVDAAIKAMQKEESDCSVLLMQKQALLDRIEAAAENRDPGQPMTVTDSRKANGPLGNYGGDDFGYNG